MPTAIVAVDFGPRHAVAAVDGGADAALEGCKEAGPASTALELAVSHEQRLPAACARKHPGTMFSQQCTRAWCLRRVITEHGVLLRRQQPAPLLIRLGDGKCRLVHDSSMPRPPSLFGHKGGRPRAAQIGLAARGLTYG